MKAKYHEGDCVRINRARDYHPYIQDKLGMVVRKLSLAAPYAMSAVYYVNVPFMGLRVCNEYELERAAAYERDRCIEELALSTLAGI